MARDIIVIGASLGGVEALMHLTKALPASLPAAVLVALHLAPERPSHLPEILNRKSSLPVSQATEGETMAKGRIYVATPNHHLLVRNGKLGVTFGPKENRHRPAVDPLFRSAARAHGSRVIGLILTGALDDGTAGLLAVKARGGATIVQDPEDAFCAEMPRNAIRYVKPDHIAPLSAIPSLLFELTKESQNQSAVGPSGAQEVPEPSEETIAEPKNQEGIGPPAMYSCPECHGTLWEIRDGGLSRYECRVGHAFSPEAMLDEQTEDVERALWVALRTLEERSSFARRIAQHAERTGQSAKALHERAQETDRNVEAIRKILLRKM
jgi:two-component system chemotaxis response regulator CheB